MTNATTTSQVAFQGAGLPKELAALLDRTRRDSLAHRRLRPAYVTISGAISQRPRKTRISAPLRVEGRLRFPSAPSAASGGTLDGRTVRFSFVLGDRQPLTRRIVVTGGGEPKLSLEARPDTVVRGLTPPGGAGTLERRRRAESLPADALLERLIETRMELVRSDQFQGFLSNPDQLGREPHGLRLRDGRGAHAVAASTSSSSGGGGPLMVLLAVGGADGRRGRRARHLGPQLEEQPSFQRIRGRGRPARRHRPCATSRPEGPRLASLGETGIRRPRRAGPGARPLRLRRPKHLDDAGRDRDGHACGRPRTPSRRAPLPDALHDRRPPGVAARDARARHENWIEA